MKNQNENRNRNNGSRRGNEADHNKTANTTPERLVLPFMTSTDDALELCRLEQDHVYMSFFMIQSWLGHAVGATVAQYAENKEPRDRSLQSGQSWRSFMETIGYTFIPENLKVPQTEQRENNIHLKPTDLDQTQLNHFVAAIFRFVQFEDPCAELMRDAIHRLWLETNGNFSLTPERSEPTPSHFHSHSPSLLSRICDWLDAVLHYAHHWGWHTYPEAYDPDPEKRELFMLGRIQRNFDIATDDEKAQWQHQYNAAIKQHADSAKLSALAAGISSQTTKLWNYQEVDTAIITIWPLVKRHNWTYADILKVIRPTLSRPNAYPCDREQTFATYCTNILGLRKTAKGKSAEGEPPGADVARRLLALGK